MILPLEIMPSSGKGSTKNDQTPTYCGGLAPFAGPIYNKGLKLDGWISQSF